MTFAWICPSCASNAGTVPFYPPGPDVYCSGCQRPLDTQERLAAQAGLAVSNIRNWEQDHRTPNVFALHKIAQALGRRMEDFVEGVAHSTKAVADGK